MAIKRREKQLTLPEGEEDDRFHHEELEDWAVGTQKLTCGKVEKEEGIQCQADRNVVDDRHVEVAAGYTEESKHTNTWKPWKPFPFATITGEHQDSNFLPAPLSHSLPQTRAEENLKPAGLPLPSPLTYKFSLCTSHLHLFPRPSRERETETSILAKNTYSKSPSWYLSKAWRMTVLIAMRGFTTQNCRVAYRNKRRGMRRQEVKEATIQTSIQWTVTVTCHARQCNLAPTRGLRLANQLCLRTEAPKRRQEIQRKYVCYLLVQDGKTLRHLGSALSIGTTGIKHGFQEELSLKASTTSILLERGKSNAEVLKEHKVMNLKDHLYLPKEGWNSLGRCWPACMQGGLCKERRQNQRGMIALDTMQFVSGHKTSRRLKTPAHAS